MATDTIPEPQTMRPTLAAEHGEGHFGFLSLAPEVRNQVYEALFEHTEPLRIADTDGYGVRLHRYLLEGSSRLEFSKHPRHALTKITDLKGAHQPGIALLCACRQIHEEAASIFYKRNVFRVSWHRSWTKNGSDTNGKFFLRGSIPWLKALGIHASMLRKIEIDLSCLCANRCWHEPQGRSIWPHTPQDLTELIEVGPLLRLIWSKTLNRLKVEFVKSRGLRQGCQSWFTVHKPDNGCNIVALNKLFTTIRVDEVNFKRYWRTIGHIGLQRDGSGGAMAFRTIRGAGGDPVGWGIGRWGIGGNTRELRGDDAHYFATSISFFEAIPGSHVRMLERESPNLLLIDERSLNLIFSYGSTYQVQKTINLDIPVDLISLTNIMLVNRAWSEATQCYLQVQTYKFEITNTNGMKRLYQWLRSPFFLSRHHMEVTYKPTASNPLTYSARLVRIAGMQVILGFKTNNMEDVRFDLVKLIEATLILKGDCTVIVRPRDVALSNTFTLAKLRSDAMLAWPIVQSEWSKKCPEIWMNGLGKIIKVEDGGAFFREDEHDYADTHEIRVTANVDPNGLRSLELATSLKQLFPHPGSSYELLVWLRDDFRGGTEPELEWTLSNSCGDRSTRKLLGVIPIVGVNGRDGTEFLPN